MLSHDMSPCDIYAAQFAVVVAIRPLSLNLPRAMLFRSIQAASDRLHRHFANVAASCRAVQQRRNSHEDPHRSRGGCILAAVLSLTSLTLAQTTDQTNPATSSNVTTTGGTVNAIPLFTTATNIQSSILTQTGTTGLNVLGKLTLPAAGAATAAGGKNSRSEGFVASAFNSTTSTAVAQTFQLQAEPAGNDTAAPSGTLNLLYGSGTAAPTETGLKISNHYCPAKIRAVGLTY